jgi:hypothetical protein
MWLERYNSGFEKQGPSLGIRMFGPHRHRCTRSANARAERCNHRWQRPALSLSESPAWLQREARAREIGGSMEAPMPIDAITLALAADTHRARRAARVGVLLGAVALMVQG